MANDLRTGSIGAQLKRMLRNTRGSDSADSLRSAECIERYRAARETGLPTDMTFMQPSWLGKHWKIAPNDFPYDQVAERHDLLIPIRVFPDSEQMTDEERVELGMIKAGLARTKEYDSMLENIPHSRTIPGHYHLHLIKFKNLTDFNHG